MASTFRHFIWCVCIVAVCGMTCAAATHTEAPVCSGPSHIAMASGSFSTRPGVTFQLKHFKAVLTPIGKTSPECFERYTDVSHAEIFVTNESLTSLFSEKLAKTDSKITDLKIANSADGVIISGKLKKLVPVFFSISGPVSTNGSEIRLDAKSIKAEGIPVKGLLAMVGEHLNAVLQLKNAKGISVQEDSLSFSPEQVAHLRGHITGVSTSPEGLTLRYGGKTSHAATNTSPSTNTTPGTNQHS